MNKEFITSDNYFDKFLIRMTVKKILLISPFFSPNVSF